MVRNIQLQEWIDGKKKPTVNQLADFAKAVHIPFGFFFLEKLPEIKNTVPGLVMQCV